MTTQTLGRILARPLGIIAALSLLALSAHADPPVGDFIDRALQTMPPAPGSPPRPSPPVAPPPAVVAPRAAIAPAAPASFAPGGGGDVVDRVLQAPQAPIGASSVPWTGLYVGLDLGHGLTRGGSGESCLNTNLLTPMGCQIIGDSALSTSGVFGGGQLGYMQPLNLYVGGLPLMVGAEADVQGTGISGSQSTSGPFAIVGFPDICSPCSYTASQSIDWFGTLRARVGVPVDRFLVYGTGGLIVGGVTASQSESFSGTQGYVANKKSTLSGPTVGGGVELLLPGNLPLSAKIEGLYYDMGDLRTVAVPQANFATNFNNFKTFGFHGTMVRLGINLHLGDLGVGF